MNKIAPTTAPSVFSAAGRAVLLGTALGFGLFAGISAVSAEEITVWSGYPELAPFYEHVAEGMKAKYPDLTVKVEAIALREHEKRIALGLTSGQSAELIELQGSTATRYLENGLFSAAPADVTTFVQDKANYNDFFANAGAYEGKVYGVPMFRGQSALFYNPDMFAAAGLTAPPTSMDDYSTYAEKLTQRDANGTPTVSGWSLRLSGGGQGIAEKFWINMFQFGGNLLEQSADGKWKASFDNETGRKALKQYLQAINNKVVTVEMPADAEAFERGQTAMFIRESWVIGDIAAKAPDLKYATANLPMGSIVSPVDLFIAGDASKADAAWAFALAANEPDNLLWMLDNVGWLPNRLGLDYSKVIAQKPGFAAFVEYPETYKFFSLPNIGPAEEVLTRIAAQLTSAFGNASIADDDAAIDAVLKTAADETNSILKREGLLAE